MQRKCAPKPASLNIAALESEKRGLKKKNPKPELGGAKRRTDLALTDDQIQIQRRFVKGASVSIRASFYIDGFNLYHAINDLRVPHLKWNNLWVLASTLIPSKSQELVRVTFCSAFYPNDAGKRARHEKYIRAQQHFGVDVIMGHYVHEDIDCRTCQATWRKPTEKETDINLALALIDDAHMDLFDHAYLVTNDSDQAATAKLFSKRFPLKKLTSVSPPGRRHSQHILGAGAAPALITANHLERSVMHHMIESKNGLIVRPPEYAPPAGWVHPRDRPQKS